MITAKITGMKKYVTPVIVMLISLSALAVLPFSGCASEDEPIRIHIRADSDSDVDQAIKYVVRDKIVEYLTPRVGSARSRAEAYRIVKSCAGEAEDIAEDILSACGFGYGANAYVARETFPDRTYGDVTYPAGEYDALIVELGSGEGANWWCVAYPPLCFYGEDGSVEYASIIAELIAAL